MEISFHSHLDSNTVIATKFCTWHDSCAVVACAKVCCNLMASNRIMARRSFHRIWIAGKKTLVKRAPDQHRSDINNLVLHQHLIGINLKFFCAVWGSFITRQHLHSEKASAYGLFYLCISCSNELYTIHCFFTGGSFIVSIYDALAWQRI